MRNLVTRYAAVTGAGLLRLGDKLKLSDEHYKDIATGISDIRELALAILENGPPFNEREVAILHHVVGGLDGHDFDTHGDYWKPELHNQYADKILQLYADHINNYEYTYKPEAQQLNPDDPDLDPSVSHVGPMAQDIEEVNEAAVKETAEGIKTVDTGRLALMNAGVIASLAREVAELKEKVNGV